MSTATAETPEEMPADLGGDNGALSSHRDAVKAERRRYQNRQNQRAWRR